MDVTGGCHGLLSHLLARVQCLLKTSPNISAVSSTHGPLLRVFTREVTAGHEIESDIGHFRVFSRLGVILHELGHEIES